VTCSIADCDSPVAARDWCKKHYMRWYHYGNPEHLRGRTLSERIWLKIERKDGHWLWTGARTSKGYGKIGIDKAVVRAHRAVYELLVEPIPDGLVLDHLCRVTSCVNPSHLEPVTQGENVRRGLHGARRRAEQP
jgi:hypothetical protein